MLYVFHCIDKKGSQGVRAAARQDHLKYLEAFGGHVFAAGPILADDGQTMTGSLLIMEFKDRGAAELFAASDPYNKAGLFESMTIFPWKESAAQRGGTMTADERHKSKMAKKKAARDKIMAAKDLSAKGLLIVHTGPGKGKTTAALGMALRCIGHGIRVGVVQFIKGAFDTAERRLLENLGGQVDFKAMGEGFTWETQDKERDVKAAAGAWNEAAKMIADQSYGMVILDELNVALRYGYVETEKVLAALASRPKATHVVITGRGAPDELIAAADLATEMKLVKHPFRSGVKAQPGVEF